MCMTEYIVDLHLHSHFSRATSPQSNLEGNYYWGKIKGIHIIGTGDLTHPGWLAELEEKLEPAEPGLFVLRKEIAKSIDQKLPASVRQQTLRFILTSEVSCVYRHNDRLRKVHVVIVVPSFTEARALHQQLSKYGNLSSDARPTLRLDIKQLLQITKQLHPDCLFIPAHVWTPWFGIFGSKSGFDSLHEAFGDLAEEVVAVETGLSSDPPMNWSIEALRHRSIVSFSDAHSPQKLGREATIIASQLRYRDVIEAIKTNDARLVGTIEFFPQEGKYHHDGHRTCGVSFSPQQTKKHQGICPVCGRPLTIGVLHRIDALAELMSDPVQTNHKKRVEYIIPLPEIVAAIKGIKSSSAKHVQVVYHELIGVFGNEFDLLRLVPLESIREQGFAEIAWGLQQMREGKIHIEPGYDGVYGRIHLELGDKNPAAQMPLW